MNFLQNPRDVSSKVAAATMIKVILLQVLNSENDDGDNRTENKAISGCMVEHVNHPCMSKGKICSMLTYIPHS
jgi:hypothetical protein